MNRLKEDVVRNIKKDLGDFGLSEVEINDRITVIRDTEQFKASEDESVWLQKKYKAPWVAEVYFDMVWCCDLYETDNHNQMLTKFFKGFLKGYESGKIRLNRFLAQIADEQEAQRIKDQAEKQDKALEALPENTLEDKLAKDVVREIVKEDATKNIA